jgi:hypothetical protein
METGKQMLTDTLENFFSGSSGEELEYLEKMLYEWYQHYAQDHYEIDKINEMIAGVFKVNDLILKLNDAMVTLKKEQGVKATHLSSDHYDYRYAS